jgi:hypothetical protein
MKIKRVTTSGFRGLPDRAYDFVNAHTARPYDLVCITGPSASGKTSVLEAIIAAKENVGPYGPLRAPSEWLAAGERVAKVRVDWFLSEEEVERAGASSREIATESIFSLDPAGPGSHDAPLASLLEDYDVDPRLGKFEYFHAGRRLAAGGARAIAAQASPAMDRMMRLTRDNGKYAGTVPFLVDLALGLLDMSGKGKTGVDTFNAMLSGLCKTIRFRGVDRIDGALRPRFVDARDRILSLDQLSDAERQAILFVASFARGGVHRSVVLVDEPEMHFAGPDLRGLALSLSQLGADNQLILATGSPEVVAGASNAHVIRLEGAGGRA